MSLQQLDRGQNRKTSATITKVCTMCDCEQDKHMVTDFTIENITYYYS